MLTHFEAVIDVKKLGEDLLRGRLEDSRQEVARGIEAYNLTHYVFNRHEGEKLWDIVNQDIGFNQIIEPSYLEVNSYGNHVPDWAYDAMQQLGEIVASPEDYIRRCDRCPFFKKALIEGYYCCGDHLCEQCIVEKFDGFENWLEHYEEGGECYWTEWESYVHV